MPHEVHLPEVLVGERPVEPADFIVLAVRIVVAALRACELIAGGQHHRALRQQQRGEKVAHLPAAQREDLGIVRRAFGAAVPGAVVTVPVAVLLAVRQVVALVVGDEIVQREAVVRRDEIDAGVGLAPKMIEEIRRAVEPGREIRG